MRRTKHDQIDKRFGQIDMIKLIENFLTDKNKKCFILQDVK